MFFYVVYSYVRARARPHPHACTCAYKPMRLCTRARVHAQARPGVPEIGSDPWRLLLFKMSPLYFYRNRTNVFRFHYEMYLAETEQT